MYPAVISVGEERITITHTRALGLHPRFEQQAVETAGLSSVLAAT